MSTEKSKSTKRLAARMKRLAAELQTIAGELRQAEAGAVEPQDPLVVSLVREVASIYGSAAAVQVSTAQLTEICRTRIGCDRTATEIGMKLGRAKNGVVLRRNRFRNGWEFSRELLRSAGQAG